MQRELPMQQFCTMGMSFSVLARPELKKPENIALKTQYFDSHTDGLDDFALMTAMHATIISY
jgi:hypothetical protein